MRIDLKQIDTDGQFEFSKVIEVDAGNIPDGFVLEQNYPNPFNPSTTIKFALAETQTVKLVVYDVLGNEVAVPLTEQLKVVNYMRQNFVEKTFPAEFIFIVSKRKTKWKTGKCCL